MTTETAFIVTASTLTSNAMMITQCENIRELLDMKIQDYVTYKLRLTSKNDAISHCCYVPIPK